MLGNKIATINRYVRFGIMIISERGVLAFSKSLLHFLKGMMLRVLSNSMTSRDRAELNGIITKYHDMPLIISRPLLDWNIPLFQRYHQLALNISRYGFLYFYCTNNWDGDYVLGFERLGENLYLTNRADIIDALQCKKIYIISSTDNYTTIDFVDQELAKGNLVLYEYIDEIHDLISCMEVPDSTRIRHEAILKDERCIVIATSDKLYRDVQAHRNRNYALVTNGVEFEHFSRRFAPEDMPSEIQHVVKADRRIVGYFGALAAWFDYELVLKIVRERPDYEVVLIGFDFDGSSLPYHLDKEPRIHVIGPIKYRDLPRYAYWFDVAIVPFLLNEITESTSPIKLFEYMALGKPIVTTAMPECRKYRSVLVAESHDDFIDKLDRALGMRFDKAYLSLLQEEALANTWQAKAKSIASLISDNLDADGKVER